MIGYKGFNVNRDGKLYCRDMIFEVGKTYEIDGEPVICEHGIHFCWSINDVHDYYNLSKSVICEVELLGDIVAAPNGKKCCTNKLKVIRMLEREEVWKISNTGSDNTGFMNTGNLNTGDWNTGFFNTKENECYIFDKPSGMTPTEFRSSKYYMALCITPLVLTEWIYYTDEEKAEDKAKELIGGYLKRYDYKEACANWWAALSDKNKEVIKQMPNFDADKFEEITGIKI